MDKVARNKKISCDYRKCVFCGGTPKEISCDSKKPTPLEVAVADYAERLSGKSVR